MELSELLIDKQVITKEQFVDFSEKIKSFADWFEENLLSQKEEIEDSEKSISESVD